MNFNNEGNTWEGIPTLSEYASMLSQTNPELFSGKYIYIYISFYIYISLYLYLHLYLYLNLNLLYEGKYTVITEFGRIYNAKSGFIVSRVEYTKVSGGRPIAIIHGKSVQLKQKRENIYLDNSILF